MNYEERHAWINSLFEQWQKAFDAHSRNWITDQQYMRICNETICTMKVAIEGGVPGEAVARSMILPKV